MNETSGQPPIQPGAQPESKRVLCGVLAILLGWLGIHKFVLGYTLEGVIMLAVSLVAGCFTFGLAASAVGVIGIVEGIVYLTKTDAEFIRIYQQGSKTWF